MKITRWKRVPGSYAPVCEFYGCHEVPAHAGDSFLVADVYSGSHFDGFRWEIGCLRGANFGSQATWYVKWCFGRAATKQQAMAECRKQMKEM